MMKKLKAFGLLGALALAAVMLVTSVPASGNSGYLITGMVSRLKRFCVPGEYREACRLIANLIGPMTPLFPYFEVPEPGEPFEPIPTDVLATFRPVGATRFAPFVAPERTCDGCVEKVSDLEGLLATNNTSQAIADMMDDACTARFKRDLASAQQCASEIHRMMPYLIDALLAELPPTTACTIGTRHPMNLCRE